MNYQQKLKTIKEYATRKDCLITISYKGFYFQCGTYDFKTVCQCDVLITLGHLDYKTITIYSKSVAGLKAKIKRYNYLPA